MLISLNINQGRHIFVLSYLGCAEALHTIAYLSGQKLRQQELTSTRQEHITIQKTMGRQSSDYDANEEDEGNKNEEVL